ncbi:MAG TPA: DUF4214 domain-containing protein, partial [Acidimicrobiales bacterium]
PSAATAAGRTTVGRSVLGTVGAWQHVIGREYERIRGIDPDPDGLQYWTTQLRAGRSPRALRAALWGATTTANDAWVAALYTTELGRTVDPAGRAWALAQLASGQTRSQLAGHVLASAEGVRALVARWTQDLFGRAPTPSEAAGWTGALHDGTDELTVRSRMFAAAAYVPLA